VTFAWGELDHVILFCDNGAPEADALKERGLHEGPANSHPGQGTSNRRFFFPNAYLEMVWVDNPIEAQSDAVRPTRLWDRWTRRHDGACPFGLVFRPGGRREVEGIQSWTYTPRYFPKGFTIQVAKDIPENEPLLFYLPFARPALVEDVRSPSAHHAQVGAIVSATLHLPETATLSPSLQALVAAGIVAVEPSREYLLDLFHVGGSKEFVDMRPELALRFRPARRASDAKH
jgi:hypothetical protein